MVKGVSKQVILFRPPEERFFEQAIFILREGVTRESVTEEDLLREARISADLPRPRQKQRLQCALWGAGGAGLTGAVWALTLLL